MMLVRDDPTIPLLPQPDRQAQAVVRVLPQLFFGPATEQGGGEGDIGGGTSNIWMSSE
jgi:hypothetical protein